MEYLKIIYLKIPNFHYSFFSFKSSSQSLNSIQFKTFQSKVLSNSKVHTIIFVTVCVYLALHLTIVRKKEIRFLD